MGVFSVVLLVIFGIAAVFLVIVVLLQDEQSEGLGGIFGGGSSNQVGNRKGNILTRTTSILGVIFLSVAFFLALINRTSDVDSIESAAKAKANQVQNNTKWFNSIDNGATTGAVSPAPATPVTASPAALGATELEASASASPQTSPASGQ